MTCLYIRFAYPNDFLYGSQFYLKNCPQYSPFIWGTINDCGIANMLCSLCWVLLPPKIAKLSEMAKTLSFMRYLAFNDQFCTLNVLTHYVTCSASIFFSKKWYSFWNLKNQPNYEGSLSKWRMTCLYIRFAYSNDFLYGSQFYFQSSPHYSPFIRHTINECGIANMLCSLRRVLLPPKIAKLSEMAKILSFMKYLASNDQFL